MQKTLQATELRAHCARILVAAGSSAQEAEKVASNLVMANLSGHDSHGVGMLPRYVDAVLEGGLTPNAQVKTVLDAGALLSLNGQRGYGQVIIVDHGGENLTVSGYLDELSVGVDEPVQKGQVIGKVGETGSVLGPGLYFELRRNGKPVDPLPWFEAGEGKS